MADVAMTRLGGEEEMNKLALCTKYMVASAMISLDQQPTVMVI